MAKIVGDYPGQVPGEYRVKDSGKREEYASGMRRDTNEGKPRYDLIVPSLMENPMLKRWAIHMAKGAMKYGDRNWEKAIGKEEYKRFRESAFRHFMQWFMGETDEDHAAAVFFNIQGAEYVAEQPAKPQCKHLPTGFTYICALCGQLVEKEGGSVESWWMK